MILVAAALAILLTVATPNLAQTASRLRAEQTAFTLVQLLRYGHERSVTDGEDVVWVWEPETRRAHLERRTDSGDPVPLTGRLARSDVLPSDLTITLMRDDTPVDRLQFFPDGTCEPTTLLVSLPGRVYTVTVDEATSQVVLTAGTAP